jgi:hypothetical protein
MYFCLFESVSGEPAGMVKMTGELDNKNIEIIQKTWSVYNTSENGKFDNTDVDQFVEWFNEITNLHITRVTYTEIIP